MNLKLFICVFSLFSLSAWALPESVNQLYYCNDGAKGYDLLLNQDKSLRANPKESDQVFVGTYSLADDQVKLSFPSLGFEESSVNLEFDKELLLTFTTPSLFCHTVGHTIGPAVEGYVKCPTVYYIPSISYEDNAFEFSSSHMVKWRHWKELLGVSDTLYSESYGIYLIEDQKLHLFFGDKKESRYLSATIHDDSSFTIDQLEPDKGPCKAN